MGLEEAKFRQDHCDLMMWWSRPGWTLTTAVSGQKVLLAWRSNHLCEVGGSQSQKNIFAESLLIQTTLHCVGACTFLFQAPEGAGKQGLQPGLNLPPASNQAGEGTDTGDTIKAHVRTPSRALGKGSNEGTTAECPASPTPTEASQISVALPTAVRDPASRGEGNSFKCSVGSQSQGREMAWEKDTQGFKPWLHPLPVM